MYWCSILHIYITGVLERQNMATTKKRLTLTLLPEWEPALNKLKKEKFFNKSFSEMLRYLIELGLKQVKETK